MLDDVVFSRLAMKDYFGDPIAPGYGQTWGWRSGTAADEGQAMIQAVAPACRDHHDIA